MPRVMMFIDGDYFFKCFEEEFHRPGFRFNGYKLFLSIFDLLQEERGDMEKYDLMRIYFYDGRDRDEKIESLLEGSPKVDVKLFESEDDATKKRGLDILMAIDVLTKAYLNVYDCAVIITDDITLVPLIESLKDVMGKRVYGAYFRDTLQEELLWAFDEVVHIEDPFAYGFVQL